jgi:glycosyltransferase involved in cell wall biosynthesis
MNAIHQFVPVLEPGAVGTHTLRLQRVIRERLGCDSEVFALEVRGDYSASDATLYGRRARAGDVLLYHLAIGSKLAELVASRAEPLIVDYHGITPPEYFYRWEPGTAAGCEAGLAELRQLASRASTGIAHSEFTRADLLDNRYAATCVAPVLFANEAIATTPDPACLDRLTTANAGGGRDWLFVSRIAPHKCQHDLVKAFAVYRRVYDPAARLHLVGGSSSTLYADALRSFIENLGLSDAVRMPGPVPDADLAAYFATADVFVGLSEHEGFGVPFLEAWHGGVPVVVYGAAAVPETVGEAAVVLPTKQPATVAAAVARVLNDDVVRTALVAAGRHRLSEISETAAEARWADVLREFV